MSKNENHELFKKYGKREVKGVETLTIRDTGADRRGSYLPMVWRVSLSLPITAPHPSDAPAKWNSNGFTPSPELFEAINKMLHSANFSVTLHFREADLYEITVK